MKNLLVLLAFGALALSCTAAPGAGSGVNGSFMESQSLPGVIKNDYRISPNDLLQIYVVGVPELSIPVKVTSTGFISFPYIDEQVRVAGYTETEVNKKLADYLEKDYLVDPQVIVTIEEYHQEIILVGGAVNTPGAYPLPANRKIDVLEAILMASGFTQVANKNKIELIREGKKTTLKFDDLTKITDPTKKVWLQPNDQIEVRESFL